MCANRIRPCSSIYALINQYDLDDPKDRKYDWEKIKIDPSPMPGYTPFHIEEIIGNTRVIFEQIPLKINGSPQERCRHEDEIRALYVHFNLEPPFNCDT